MNLIKHSTKALLVLSFAGMTSCSKSFLDKQPYDAVALSSAIKNDADMNAAINGVYANLRSVNLYGRSLVVKGDLMSDNSFLTTSNSGRYTQWNQYTTLVNNDAYSNPIWTSAYIAIKNANQIINSSVATNDNVSQLQAEAYAIRALMHFELVRNFAPAYTIDNTKPGVPIVTSFDQNSLPARSSIKDVYTQIIADLTKAASLVKYSIGGTMTFNLTGSTRTLNTSYITKYAISALLARVYQNMGDWANAKTAALDVVNSGGFTLAASTAYSSYWASLNPRTDKLETIFEITSDANGNNGSDYLAGIFLTSALGGAYGDILVVPSFYATYAATDVRKSLYSTGTRTGQASTAIYVRKYTGNTTDYDDTKVIRYSDVLLILAEAYYNTADPVNANLYLNKVAKQRDPSFLGYASTGTAILDDIINERKKELAFEGSRFWDLVRLKQTFTKVQDQDLPSANLTIAPGHTNLVFPIPVAEINANPNITQNPGYK